MNENSRVKCEYLQQEVESLKLQLKDAMLVNDLNKRALSVCYNPNNFQTDNESKAAVFLLHHIMEENNILRKQIETLRSERNHAFDRALLNEQLSEVHQKQEKWSLEELQEKIEEMRGKLKERDQTIYNLQNNKHEEGLIYIEKEIVSISDIVNKMNNKIQQQNIVLIKYYNQIQELQDQKDDLAKLNFVNLKHYQMKFQNQGLNAQLQKDRIIISVGYDKQDPNYYLQKLVRLQKRVLLDESDEESKDNQQSSAIFSPLFSPLPLKVNQKRKQTFEIPAIDPEVNIPKLKLDKAKQIQEYNIKRLQHLQAVKLTQNYDPVDLEEKLQKLMINDIIVRLTHDLLTTKNKYHAQLVYNQQLESSLNEQQRVYKDCLAVNDTLIKSIKGYEDKWKCIFYQYNFYKTFYIQYKDYISSSHPQTGKQNQENSIPLYSSKEEQQQMSYNICDLERIFSNSRRMAGDRSSHQVFPKDFSMMNSPDDFQTLSRVPSQRNDEEGQNSQQQTNYKQLLISFAKDVYNIFQQTKIPQHRSVEPRFKRSYSNTLDYVI